MSAISDPKLTSIPHQIISHNAASFTSQEAASALNFKLGQIVKSLLLLGRSGAVLILLPGNKKLDFKKVWRFLQDKKFRLGKPEEVLQITGYPVGLVTPFGCRHNLRTILDKSVLGLSQIALSAGEWGKDIVLTPSNLTQALNPEIADLIL